MGIHVTIDRTKQSGVAIMGGTFDPIHNGHLRTAVEVLERYQYASLRIIPCFQPVHKDQPGVTPSQRLDMAQLAITSHPGLSVDAREITRQGPSYTIDTLREIREELGAEEPLIMVLGMDSFLSLPTWSEWKSLLHYAHILVVSRPGWEPDLVSELSAFCEKYRASAPHELQCAPSGRIWLETLTPLGISSSMIRLLASRQESIAYLLPEPVQKYIEKHTLYR